jgi:hypothetical protein
VIAHGAGGSGKTFTLAGPDLTPALNEEQFGVLPRSSSLFSYNNNSEFYNFLIVLSYFALFKGFITVPYCFVRFLFEAAFIEAREA